MKDQLTTFLTPDPPVDNDTPGRTLPDIGLYCFTVARAISSQVTATRVKQAVVVIGTGWHKVVTPSKQVVFHQPGVGRWNWVLGCIDLICLFGWLKTLVEIFERLRLCWSTSRIRWQKKVVILIYSRAHSLSEALSDRMYITWCLRILLHVRTRLL